MKKILTISEVESLTNLSRSTIRRLENKDIFPKRVKLGSCRVGWLSEEIESWINQIKLKRGDQHARN